MARTEHDDSGEARALRVEGSVAEQAPIAVTPPGEATAADSIEPPRRRFFSADEARLLLGAARTAGAALPFGLAFAALAFHAGAPISLRLSLGGIAALVLATLIALLVSRPGEHALGWGLKVGLCAGVTAALLLKGSARLAIEGPGAGASAVLAIVMVAQLAATIAFALVGRAAAMARFRRRVVLLDQATAEQARAATGEEAPALLGPIALADRATLQSLVEAGIDEVVVGRPMAKHELAALSYALRDASVRIHALAPPDAAAPEKLVIGALPTRMVSYRRTTLTPAGACLKRAGDFAIALVALALTAPLFALIALAVKLGSPGPVFFGQTRVGLRGPFRALKFRTMFDGAHLAHERLIEAHGNMFKLRRDPRVTPIGRFLRRFSLDELPQLLQVLTGDMSLIGPRPPMPEEVARYSLEQLRRLGVKPGLTGLWQVSGRSDLPFDRWVELDAQYIEQWSPRLDLWILAKTFGAVLSGRGAY